jgi:mevalonate kinase
MYTLKRRTGEAVATEKQLEDAKKDLEAVYEELRKLGGDLLAAGREQDLSKLREHLRVAGGRLANLKKRGRTSE